MWPKFSSTVHGGRGREAYRESFTERAARWLRRLALAVLALALLTGAATAGRLLYRFTYQSEFFRLKPEAINIDGASKPLQSAARAELIRYLETVTDNLCRLSSARLTADLGALPRSRAVRIRKRYPAGLDVEFDERHALMVAKLDRKYLVDEDGMLIDTIDDKQLPALGLPILTGVQGGGFHPGSRLVSPRVHDVLAAVLFIRDHDPGLRDRIVEWNANGRNEVTAILRSGTEVRFGDSPPLDLLDKLSGGLASRPALAQATYIDLRMDKQIVYK